MMDHPSDVCRIGENLINKITSKHPLMLETSTNKITNKLITQMVAILISKITSKPIMEMEVIQTSKTTNKLIMVMVKTLTNKIISSTDF